MKRVRGGGRKVRYPDIEEELKRLDEAKERCGSTRNWDSAKNRMLTLSSSQR